MERNEMQRANQASEPSNLLQQDGQTAKSLQQNQELRASGESSSRGLEPLVAEQDVNWAGF